MPNPAEDPMADFIISLSHRNNNPRISSIDQERRNLSGQSSGEPSYSSAPNEASHKEQKSGDSWSASTSGCVGASPRLEERGCEPPSITSLDNVNANSQYVQSPNLNATPQTLNLNASFVGHGSDLESFKSSGPGSSSDDGHLSRKRKAVEGHVGQSSMSESPGLSDPSPLEQLNPTLELGPTGLPSESIANSAQASRPDTSQRNVRSRAIQDSLPPPLFSSSQRGTQNHAIPTRELGNSRSGIGTPTNGSVPGTIASTSGTGSSSDVNPLAAPIPNWASLPIPSSRSSRILAEYARRSLLSSANAESGGQSSNGPLNSGPAGSSDDEIISSGFPNPSRTLAAGERRSGLLLSEIHNILDLIRRGEGLQFEDFIITGQSLPFRVPDIHDRHRDMRLDVDNMSYEDLLDLEERIGNVNTGLSEETISEKLKPRKYSAAENSDVETEPCSVCQEKYVEGEDIGTLDCGHDYHIECIKQWLVLKNWCPICKTTGLAT